MKNINWKKLLLQVGIYCFGLLVLAFGVAFSVNSDLGVSPEDAHIILELYQKGIAVWRCNLYVIIDPSDRKSVV